MEKLIIIRVEKAVQPDALSLDGKLYYIRFPPINAQHIAEQVNDPVHKIGFVEIVSVLKKGFVVDSGKKKRVVLGKFGNQVYECYVIVQKGWIDVLTAFRSNKMDYVRMYEDLTT